MEKIDKFIQIRLFLKSLFLPGSLQGMKSLLDGVPTEVIARPASTHRG
jgi:hypothetical protein